MQVFNLQNNIHIYNIRECKEAVRAAEITMKRNTKKRKSRRNRKEISRIENKRREIGLIVEKDR